MSAWGRDRREPPRGRLGGLAIFAVVLLAAAAGAALYGYLDNRGVIHLVGSLVAEPPASIGELEDRIGEAPGPGSEVSREVVEQQRREIDRLSSDRDRLSAELDNLRAGGTDVDTSLRGKTEELQTLLAERENELARARSSLQLAEQINEQTRARLSLAETVIADLEARPDPPASGSGNDRNSSETAKIREQLAERTRQLEQRDELLTEYDEEIRRLQKIEVMLIESQGALADKEAELAALKGELARARGGTGAPNPRGDEAGGPASGDDSAAAGAIQTPRDPLKVAAAMRQSAGLRNIDDAKRDRIATRLIEGDCVADVLTDEFGRAPTIAMRDLISELQSDC